MSLVSYALLLQKAAPHVLVTVAPYLVYDIVKRPDRYVLLPVGRVPAGLPCDPTQGVNGMNVVPVASVTWFGTVRPPVVVAACG